MDMRLERRRRREKKRRLTMWGVSALVAIAWTMLLVSGLAAQENQGPDPTADAVEEPAGDAADADEQEVQEPLPPELSIAKTVDRSSAPAGSTLEYTVVMDNDGDSPALNVTLTDSLPAEVEYIPGSLSVSGGGLWGEAGGVITWTGNIMDGSQVVVSFEAMIDVDVLPMTSINNTAGMGWDGNTYEDTATTTVSEITVGLTNYLPIIYSPPPLPPNAPLLSVTRANNANQWTVAWTNPAGTETFQLQEALTPDFSNPTIYNVGLDTSIDLQHGLNIFNEYYYRVRGLNEFGESEWSNVGLVIAGYRDSFDTSINNWGIRRTTYIEEVDLFHEVMQGNGLLILRVEDSWDWGIASPMVKAPPPPYVLEYRSQVANYGNLVSHGMAFGADWPGEICPDWSTLPGVYEHSLCFNHFYLPNNIYYGDMKMLFERVDYLTWCPGCGGSPMKRLSNDYSVWFTVEPVNAADPEGWNIWRYEVRDSGITFFVNGVQFASTPDTTWINEPYFGVFGSTDEYSNSTTRFDYVEVRPLDN